MAAVNPTLTRYMERAEPLVRRLALAYWRRNEDAIADLQRMLKRLRKQVAAEAAEQITYDTHLATLGTIEEKVLNHLERGKVTTVRHLFRIGEPGLLAMRGIGVRQTRELLRIRDELRQRLRKG